VLLAGAIVTFSLERDMTEVTNLWALVVVLSNLVPGDYGKPIRLFLDLDTCAQYREKSDALVGNDHSACIQVPLVVTREQAQTLGLSK
jgi:hypothetical protein